MRITGGVWRNQLIKTPKGLATRPTPSMVREAVFNMTQEVIHDASVLDLFAGSGIMSIEALSRGAKEATLIENNLQARRCIEQNCKEKGITTATLLPLDALIALKKIYKNNHRFNWIYADPPYSQGIGLKIIEEIDHASLLLPGGFFFLEEGEPLSLPSLHSLIHSDTRRYGRTCLHIFRSPLG